MICAWIDQMDGKVTNDLLQLNILESLLAYVFAILMKILVGSFGISEDRKSGRTSQSLGAKTLLVRPSQDFPSERFSPGQSTKHCIMAAGTRLA
jgi:hypothetical protein